MSEPAKRKAAPGGRSQEPRAKKSKGGNGGKWQTPHFKAKLDSLRAKGKMLEVGDVGFWVTCQRGKEQRALEELMSICSEYGEKLYGIKPADEAGDDSEGEDVDIEASIQKEIDSMKKQSTGKARQEDAVFDPMRMNLDCLLFMRTKPPVEPVEFSRRICEDAKLITDRGQRKSRFINRFIPIKTMGKATENGLEEVARAVLVEHFQLAGVVDEKPLDGNDQEDKAHSYAIRITSRAHNTLKRDEIIKQVAGLIDKRHKVDLTTPAKIILVEIYQTFCGMSVVDGDWEDLKRYNLNELYIAAISEAKASGAKEEEQKKAEGEEKEAEGGEKAVDE